MQTALIIIHVIISIALIVVVLMQHGKQQGLSGAIAGGAETFFGKNKGRTIDAMLKKVTSVIAVLFVLSSIVLAVYSINKDKAAQNAASNAVQQQTQQTQQNDSSDKADSAYKTDSADKTANNADANKKAE